MSALVCAATHFMGGNGHFISGRRKSSGREVFSGRDVVCDVTNLRLLADDRSTGKAPTDAHGFARRSAYGEVVNR